MVEIIIGGVIVGIILIVLGVILTEPIKKLWNKIRIKPKKPTAAEIRKREDLKLLSATETPLLTINQIRGFPDTSNEELRDALFEIRSKATGIESEKFSTLKKNLLSYSEKADKLTINTGLVQRINLLLKEDGGAFKLVEDVREAISPNYKRTIEQD